MPEPSRLPDTTIASLLHAHYGVSTRKLTFLELGNDAASWVYRVQSNDGRANFLKVRANDRFNMSSLVIPHYLQTIGVPHIVAPRQTKARRLWVGVDEYVLSLTPFIDGRQGAEVGLSAQQWRTFGSLAKQIHDCRLPPELHQLVPRESYVPDRRQIIPDLEAAVAAEGSSNVIERELAAFWRAQWEIIRTLVNRADELGQQLQRGSKPLVLCHADMHVWNLLVDSDQHVWLVDWDDTVMAHKERDLMFVVGGVGGDGIGAEETASFMQGYGRTEVDAKAMSYYRYAWAVQDIAAYGEQVFLSPELREDARRAALLGFQDLFAPGRIVSLALASSD